MKSGFFLIIISKKSKTKGGCKYLSRLSLEKPLL
jgi:hypothetical protein